MNSFLAETGGLLCSSPDPTLHDDHVGADPPAVADAPVGAGSDAVSGEPRGTSAAVRSASKSSGRIVENSSKSASSPAEQPAAASPAKRITRKRRTCKRGKTVEKVTSAFEIQPPPVEPCVKRPRRTQKRNVRLSDYVVGHVHAVQGDIEIPTTYKQARASQYWSQWKAAMLAELQSLRGHRTWRLVPRSSAKKMKVITCRWVFAVKRDEGGRVTRFKARLVIHGFKHQRGVNYSETFAPVIRFETTRAAIYYVVQRGWAPPGFQEVDPDYVCRLLKSLYGLKQAPRIWNKTLHIKLVTMGFERLDSDFGLDALKKDGEVRMLLTVYVDNLLLMRTPELCTATAAALKESFELTTMGNVKYLLGVEILIDRPRRQIIYSQQQYVVDVLKEYHMSTCNGCATPEATLPSKAGLPETIDIPPYRELVGSLQYLVSTSRPDIAHAATKDYGLVQDVSKGTSAELVIYSDADYANDPADRRSISGYVTMLDGNVLSYASRKQEINAMSTCEAAYMAISEAAKDILWLQGLCKELAWLHPVPLMFGDNEGAIALSVKPGKQSKTKHIENKYHMVRRDVELKRITVKHCGSEDMVADIMTKALGAVKSARFRKMILVLPVVTVDGEMVTTSTASAAQEPQRADAC
ncbi:unnamed protein product [Phytophthora fragariaefolia]|uniref:Unnamed protein product n=1 Tax=Phytophthora fragariaefolia TaxID=1490495 RepID=A0A9W6U302_9STRA|nr:unnamed protein product [Phytophthora fragariaefolia]